MARVVVHSQDRSRFRLEFAVALHSLVLFLLYNLILFFGFGLFVLVVVARSRVKTEQSIVCWRRTFDVNVIMLGPRGRIGRVYAAGSTCTLGRIAFGER